jgi:hypothetical protein
MKLLLASRHNADGFRNPLELEADQGETLKSVIDKLNKYRSPENQIKHLYTMTGESVSLSMKIKSDMRLYLD